MCKHTHDCNKHFLSQVIYMYGLRWRGRQRASRPLLRLSVRIQLQNVAYVLIRYGKNLSTLPVVVGFSAFSGIFPLVKLTWWVFDIF